jgi:hypothetical protein
LRENVRIFTSESGCGRAREYTMNHLCIASALLVLATPLSAKADSVTVNPLLTTSVTASGQPIVLPQGNVQLITSSQEYKPGDFIVESRGQWHKAENIGAEPIKLLVIDQINPGESTVVLRHPGATVGHN